METTTRTYNNNQQKSSKKRTKLKKYTEDDVKNAIDACNNKKLSLREAARVFNVPAQTLSDRLRGRLNRKAAQCLLSEHTEKLICELLIHLGEIGFGITKKLFLNLITNYAQQTGQTHLFKNGTPSANYFYRFMNRHKDKLKTLKAQNISEIRARSTTSEVFDEWFRKVGDVYEKYDLRYILDGGGAFF